VKHLGEFGNWNPFIYYPQRIHWLNWPASSFLKYCQTHDRPEVLISLLFGEFFSLSASTGKYIFKVNTKDIAL